MKNKILYIVFVLLLSRCGKEQTASHHAMPQTQASSDLMLTQSQMNLANISTAPVRRKPVGQTLVVNATLKVNEAKTEVISSRTAGRVEKLLIKETGQPVIKGQPLYVLYSETLLTLEQEYLLAKEQYEALGQTEPRYRSYLDAAERKLLLYGLTRPQISKLTRNSIEGRTTFLAPAAGITTEVGAVEGQYVDEGSVLYRIEDISSLWVEAELYANETALVSAGDKVSVRMPGGADVEAEVTFLTPEFRNNSQITLMRATIQNERNDLRPGQHAQVFLTHSSREGIAIPSDAVIRDGKGKHVYVQSGKNTFRPKKVQTGIETPDEVEITEGLSEGDTVAVTGAYLLYSEYVLKKGQDPVAVHHH